MIANKQSTCPGLLFAALTVFLLASCGIDQGGINNPPPTAAASTLVVSGPIERLATLTVNATELETGGATVLVDGIPAGAADLRAGQVVRAIARTEGATNTALLIEFQKNLSGNVASLDPPAGLLTVLGQTIRTDGSTRFDIPGVASLADLQPGTRILVSGIPKPDGELFASYVGADDAADPFELTAVITAADAPALTFSLGALSIDYSQAMLLDIVGGIPQPGAIVQVTGSSLANGELIADRVRAVARLPGAFSAAATQISDGELAVVGPAPADAERSANFVGFIATPALPDSVAVDDVDVRIDDGTQVIGGLTSDLQPGQRVRVEGPILEFGRVQATVITIL